MLVVIVNVAVVDVFITVIIHVASSNSLQALSSRRPNLASPPEHETDRYGVPRAQGWQDLVSGDTEFVGCQIGLP